MELLDKGESLELVQFYPTVEDENVGGRADNQ